MRLSPVKYTYVQISNRTPPNYTDTPLLNLLSEDLEAKCVEKFCKQLLDPQGLEYSKPSMDQQSKSRRDEVARRKKDFEARQLRIAREMVRSVDVRIKTRKQSTTRCKNLSQRLRTQVSASRSNSSNQLTVHYYKNKAQ